MPALDRVPRHAPARPNPSSRRVPVTVDDSGAHRAVRARCQVGRFIHSPGRSRTRAGRAPGPVAHLAVGVEPPTALVWRVEPSASSPHVEPLWRTATPALSKTPEQRLRLRYFRCTPERRTNPVCGDGMSGGRCGSERGGGLPRADRAPGPVAHPGRSRTPAGRAPGLVAHPGRSRTRAGRAPGLVAHPGWSRTRAGRAPGLVAHPGWSRTGLVAHPGRSRTRAGRAPGLVAHPGWSRTRAGRAPCQMGRFMGSTAPNGTRAAAACTSTESRQWRPGGPSSAATPFTPRRRTLLLPCPQACPPQPRLVQRPWVARRPARSPRGAPPPPRSPSSPPPPPPAAPAPSSHRKP
jgi:hypothetical protein